MDYGMIGKIEKAKRYAQERTRFHFNSFTVTMDGENNPHTVSYNNNEWHCDCDFFHSRGRCSHTMALEFILEGMLNGQEIKV
ncbi:MAG TPA: SWIM zinc finger family protein [Anaerolineaceae bacterium]|nr:SWIM zinc finger family protein [Anaerolineaceae bacterium]